MLARLSCWSPEELCQSDDSYSILGTKLSTKYSNNIRNNRGFLTRCEERPDQDPALLFYQEGRKVFKEVTTLVSSLLGRASSGTRTGGSRSEIPVAPSSQR